MKNLKHGLLIGGCLIFGNALGGSPEILPPPPMAFLPYSPGVSLYGLGGNGWTAIGDLMVPVVGNINTFTYIDPQFSYHSSDSEFTGSAGLGQRWLSNSYGILGAYVFGDYNNSLHNRSFWFVSPGVERLGVSWDFSANLYIPVSDQRKNTGTTFADNVGDFDHIAFVEHEQFDELVNTFESTGVGGDAEIGYRLPAFHHPKLFLGGYYFNQKDHDNIGGGFVRAEVPVTPFISAMISDAYDNEAHNTLKAGLTFWFGARNTGYDFDGNLVSRMVDPVRRNLIVLSGSSHTGQPIAEGYDETGVTQVEMSNISFFLPETPTSVDNGQVVGDGTYENPYRGMSQDNVNDANMQDNRNFYINSGTYNAMYGTTNPDFIVLNNDQLYGRQSYKGKTFVQAAEGNLRPLMQFSAGGFLIPSTDVNDGLTGLRLQGNGVNEGIRVDHTDSNSPALTVNIANLSEANFDTGMLVENNSANPITVQTDDSEFSNNVTDGIGAFNNGAGDFNLSVNYTKIADNLNNGVTLSNLTDGKKFSAQFNHDEISGSNSLFNSGINVEDSSQDTALNIDVNFTKIFDNDFGVKIFNSSMGNTDSFSFNHSSFTNNTRAGYQLDGAGSGGSTSSNFVSTSFVNNQGGGINILSGTGDNDLNLTIVGSSITGSSSAPGVTFSNLSPSNTSLKIISSNISNNLSGIFYSAQEGLNAYLLIAHSVINDNTNFGVSTVNNDTKLTAQIESSIIDGNGAEGITMSNAGDLDLTINTTRISNNGGNGFDIFQTLPITLDVITADISINHSFISNNGSNGINLTQNTTSVGGINLLVNRSQIKNNGADGIHLEAQGTNNTDNITIQNSSIIGNTLNGITLLQTGNTAINANIDHSTIKSNGGNGIDFEAPSNINQLNVAYSAILKNGEAGITTSGSISTTVDHSIIAKNGIALQAFNGSVMDITNPIFFKGVINLDGMNSITFPGGLTPNNNEVVKCVLNRCQIISSF